MGALRRAGTRLSMGGEDTAQAVPWDLQVGHQEDFLYRRGGYTLVWAAQAAGTVTIPGGV